MQYDEVKHLMNQKTLKNEFITSKDFKTPVMTLDLTFTTSAH